MFTGVTLIEMHCEHNNQILTPLTIEYRRPNELKCSTFQINLDISLGAEELRGGRQIGQKIPAPFAPLSSDNMNWEF